MQGTRSYRVKSLLNRVWREDEGVLTFEWILLITVLTIGIVGGLSAVRDAVITELGDVAEAVISLDQSYTILPPWEVMTPDCVQDGASGSSFTDEAGLSEDRSTLPPGQPGVGPCGEHAEGGVQP
jgi:Flp pilus assembly pilin Flp